AAGACLRESRSPPAVTEKRETRLTAMNDSNRRSFLMTGAAAAAGISLARGANDRIRAAIVGCRGRGWDLMQVFHTLAKPENVELAAICEVDDKVASDRLGKLEKLSGARPKVYTDIRKLLEDKSIDVVAHSTPNHWHVLGALWTCQAGKDAYVEKPMTHNIWEGRKLVEAARKYNRMVQHGTQSRSGGGHRKAAAFLAEGKLGPIKVSRGLCYKRRGSIGKKPEGPIPKGVDFNLWLGPAPERAFNPNTFHYNWHWRWDTGNGDIGNQGVH